ncbi:MAG: hypothetical protein SOT68_07940 [Oscillospiraceae bacterium]|nr:hypothetical protein [Oscillospiraceae bacterium]MDD7278266.1 hypothetical protein [Oscillospiraceae bacterium]MDY2864113.1 hypothetical protein [Oscillospiraceae bacterium]
MKAFFPSKYLSMLDKVDFSAAKSVKITKGGENSSIEFTDEDSLEVKLSMSEAISLFGVGDDGRVNKIGLGLEYIYDEIILNQQNNP